MFISSSFAIYKHWQASVLRKIPQSFFRSRLMLSLLSQTSRSRINTKQNEKEFIFIYLKIWLYFDWNIWVELCYYSWRLWRYPLHLNKNRRYKIYRIDVNVVLDVSHNFSFKMFISNSGIKNLKIGNCKRVAFTVWCTFRKKSFVHFSALN